MTWPIVQVQYTLITKLNCCDQSNWVPFVIKTKQDNDMTNCKGAVYAKNNIELSWLIGLGVDGDENQIGQLHD